MSSRHDHSISSARSRRGRAWPHGLAAVAGLIGAAVGLGGAGPSSVVAQGLAYSPAAEVPQQWRQFAQGLQLHFRDRLQADNGPAGRRLAAFLAARRRIPALLDLKILVKTWVRSDGTIERLEVGGIDDRQVNADLRAVLGSGRVGTPPSDLLQPVQIGLTLERPRG
jgi:hypothetical protein